MTESSDNASSLNVPKWLQELEAKRESRMRARLGHESGAGAACLTCADKCPGLDLHFWRKICKSCKCSKEAHDVHDDDIYGWAQFQLLGNKPANRGKRRIVLADEKTEVEVEWAPPGAAAAVDSYLSTLPPNELPIAGSQAALDRRRQFLRQVPMHDFDDRLCHELSPAEQAKQRDYFDHIKRHSVGVGHVVPLQPLDAIQVPESEQTPLVASIGRIIDMPATLNVPVKATPTLWAESVSVPTACAATSKCRRCQRALDAEFGVWVKRSGALYHNACFRCFGCHESLVDLMYFYDRTTDEVYCGRDYAHIRGYPRCRACDELIFVKEYCLAENQTYHLKHFCCFECDRPLAGSEYVVEAEQPICFGCFETLKADRCQTCGRPILPHQKGVNLKELHFHATSDCFKCAHCHLSLLDGKVLLQQDQLFCSKLCYNNFV